jgi:alpha-galactosidase
MAILRRHLIAAALTLLATALPTLPASAASLDSASSQKAAAEEKWYSHGAGRCLDASLSQGVALKDCSSSAYQQWTYPASGSRLLHKQSLRCLDGSMSQGVKLAVCDPDSPYQKWTYIADLDTLSNGVGNCLDGSISQGVRVVRCNSESPYQWWFRMA